MSITTKVTLFKGGTKEKTLPIVQVAIPDMCHIADAIRKKRRIDDREACAEAILTCWHIAGSLKEYIYELP